MLSARCILSLLAVALCLLVQTASGAKTAVTLEVEFLDETEDVSILFKTEVPVGETIETLLEQPFGSLPSEVYRNETYTATILIDEDQLYRLEIRQRFAALGIRKYSLFRGTSTEDRENIIFVDSAVQEFEGNYVFVPSHAARSSLRATPPPIRATSATTRITSAPSPTPTSVPSLTPSSSPSSAPYTRTLAPTKDIYNDDDLSATMETVLFVIRFGHTPEHVKILIEEKPILDKDNNKKSQIVPDSNIIFKQDFGSLSSSEFRNKAAQVALSVEEDVVYSLKVFQRGSANGVKSYALFEGTKRKRDFILVSEDFMIDVKVSKRIFMVDSDDDDDDIIY